MKREDVVMSSLAAPSACRKVGIRRKRRARASVEELQFRTYGGCHGQPHVLILALTLALATILDVRTGGGAAEAAVPCNSTEQCEAKLRVGSTCSPTSGLCTNPLRTGCLRNLLPDRFPRLRVCNSDDPPDAVRRGHCRPPDPDLDYMEIRVASQNWESAFFSSWILQILLSELLDVPTTIETGMTDKGLDFYDEYNVFDYGASNDFDAMRRAYELGDCRKVPRRSGSESAAGPYSSCAHIITEVWYGQLEQVRRNLTDRGIIEPALPIGVLGQNNWFIPRFTGEQDPTLLTHFGLTGEENRRKLAETFLRPTTWGDYCALVSSNNCSMDDGVAKRIPATDAERSRMFVDGLYTGHFRFTERNNCTLYPDNCTGHIADYPCGWASYVKPLTHHLRIALDGDIDIHGGYSYGQLVDMWQAANATGSNLIAQWWTPEALYQTYLGTETELQKVTLPPPTYTCFENRVVPGAQCDPDWLDQVGDPRGACDEAPYNLQKLIAGSVQSLTYDPEIPEAKQSPALQVMRRFAISNVQLDKMFDYWLKRGIDKWNYDPRDAVCRWVAENIDLLKEYIPRTYPRIVVEDKHIDGLFYTSLALSVFVTTLVLVASHRTYRLREEAAIKFAQIEFLFLFLGGLFLLGIGAVVKAVPPTNVSCVAVIWFINLGYTLELVPLIVKVSAINQLLGAARQFRRISVSRASLFRKVFFVEFLMVVYLIVWSALDRPTKRAEYELTDESTSNRETIVTVSYYCQSDSKIWWYASISWNMLLLISATVLAVQTRKMRQEFSESQTLAVMTYSHFVFLILRVATLFLGDVISSTNLARVLSLIYSGDVMTAIIVYFVPKFLGGRDYRRNLERIMTERFQHRGPRGRAMPQEHLHGVQKWQGPGQPGIMTRERSGHTEPAQSTIVEESEEKSEEKSDSANISIDMDEKEKSSNALVVEETADRFS